MLKDLKYIISILIYLFIFFYSYTKLVIYYGLIFYMFSPEYIFIYGFVSIFIFSIFHKMNKHDCFWSYFTLMWFTIRQYTKVLNLDTVVSTEYWYTSPLSISIKITILASVGIILFFMYMLEDNVNTIFVPLNFEFLILILLCILGILIFTCSNHLLILYLGIELQSLALYILCCFKFYSNKSIEAGLKYFIYGSYSSLILLLGISFLYLIFGTLNFNDLNLLISIMDINNYILLHVGLICILIGFFFKLAVFPFHWWLPEIFEGSPDVVTFFLALVPKLPFFFMLFRLNLCLYINFPVYSYIMMICGLLSILVGTILALYTTKLKKLFAYSSIVHMGYMILALGLGSEIGLGVPFYYFLIYLLSTVNIFSIYYFIRVSHVVAFSNITDLSYLKNSNKAISLMTIVSLLSLAGIPPFMGFFGKLFIFNIFVGTGNYAICLILLFTSIISTVYYIRLIRFIFFDDRKEEPLVFQKVKSPLVFQVITIFFMLNIIFIFFQEPLWIFIIYILN